ncbi:hypothetical protein EON83_08850 [bacterium]|nr:MAG: hypothetical protein EON83_08850 [bacterium]
MQIVSPQTRALLQVFARFFVWLFVAFKSKWRGFLLRFAPLWGPLLLIWALPMPQEMTKSNYLGGTGYESSAYIRALPDVLTHALAEPDNLGAQLSAIGRTRDYQYQGYSYTENYRPSDWVAPWYDDESEESLAIPETREWFKRIQTRFSEPWLPAYLASIQKWNESESFYLFPYNDSRTDQLQWLRLHRVLSPQTRQLRADLEASARREPQNAFWILKLAQWHLAYAPRSFYPPPPSNFAFASPASAAMAPGAAFPSPPPGPMIGTPGGLASPIVSLPATYPLGPHPLPPLVPNEDAVLKHAFAILLRSHSCTYFEDGYWQANLHIKRDLQALRPMSLETSSAFFESVSTGREYIATEFVRRLQTSLWGQRNVYAYSYPSVAIPYALGVPPLSLGDRTPPREMLTWAAGMAHIARLKERGNPFANSWRNNTASRWLESAWELDTPPLSLRLRMKRTTRTGATTFATRVRQLGLPDLAREALATQQEFSARDTLYTKADAHQYYVLSGLRGLREQRGANALTPKLALTSATMCLGIATTFVFLCPVWMFLNIWLARGVGAPSSHPSRWWPALVLTIVLGLPLLWNFQHIGSSTSAWNQLLMESPFIFAATLVVLLALWCVTLTVYFRRSELVSPENERWHTHFLSRDFRPWIEPLLLGASVLIVAFASAVLFYFMQVPGTGSAPLPLSSIGIFTVENAVGALAIYGIGAGFIAFLILLFNWRWPLKSVRPVTHGGLRWWKESIGASICVLAWMYLGVALMAWPARNQAKQMIEERWQMGDWVWLQKNL